MFASERQVPPNVEIFDLSSLRPRPQAWGETEAFMMAAADETPGPADHALLVGAAYVALATLAPVTLYQLGMIPRLADPPLSIFDSKQITTSKTAHPFGIPDGLLGLASFATTLTLALLSRRSRSVDTVLGAKLILDASTAAFDAGRQVVSFGKLCSWCTGTARSAGMMAYAGRASIRNSLNEVGAFEKSV